MAQCLTNLALTLFGTTIFTQPASILTTIYEETTTSPGYELITSSCDGGYKGGYTGQKLLRADLLREDDPVAVDLTCFLPSRSSADQPGACSHWTTYPTSYPGTPVVSTRTETITVVPGSTVTSSFPTATQYSTTCSSETSSTNASPGSTTSAPQSQVTPPPVSGVSSYPSSIPVVSESSLISDPACIDEPVTLYGSVIADYFPGYSTSIGETTTLFSEPIETVTTTCIGGFKGPYTDLGACSSWTTSAYTTWTTKSSTIPFTSVVTVPGSAVTSIVPTYTQSAINCYSATPGIGGIISNAGLAEATTPAQVITTTLPTETTTSSTAKISNHVGITAGAAGGIVLLSSSILALFLHKRNTKKRGMKIDREASRYSALDDGADGNETSGLSKVKPSTTLNGDYMYGYGSSRIAIQHQNFPPSTPLPPLPPFTIERGQEQGRV